MLRPRVLLVDDVQELVLALTRGLSAEFDVIACVSGAAALQALATAEPFDALIIDVVMDGITGADLYDRLSDAERARVVFMTAGPVTEALHQFVVRMRARVIVLEKPFDMGELRDAVRSAVNQRGPRLSRRPPSN